MNIKPFGFVTIFLFSIIVFDFVAAEEKKKLKLVLDRLEKVKDAEHVVSTELEFVNVDGEVVVNGVVETYTDFDDNYKLNINILHSKDEGGEMKKVIGIVDKGICETMQNQYKKYLYESLKNHCNAPEPDGCPVVKDKYTVDKYPLDNSKFAHLLRPGFYHIIGTLLHNNEEVLQYRIEAHTEEE